MEVFMIYSTLAMEFNIHTEASCYLS